jgi:hypothetical protein
MNIVHLNFVPDQLLVGDKRYLVVDPNHRLTLDPSDAGQMMRFAVQLASECHNADGVARAVRELLPKPLPAKPVEPAGLGAVVKDGGYRWVHFYSASGSWWRNKNGRDRRWSEFSDSVTILSAGVE